MAYNRTYSSEDRQSAHMAQNVNPWQSALVTLLGNQNNKDMEKEPMEWNGFCPESQLEGKEVRMRLNRNDFFESEASGLQAMVLRGVCVVLMKERGTGDFRFDPEYADMYFGGEYVLLQRSDNPPFFQLGSDEPLPDKEEIRAFLSAIMPCRKAHKKSRS